MLRAFIRVVRPLDWTGSLARVAMTVVTIMAMIPVVLARLPAAWVELAFGQAIVVRVAIGLVVWWLFGTIRMVVYAQLPRAVWKFGGRLGFRDRGRRRRVRVADVAEIFVEAPSRPSDQVFSIALRDGSYLELCPVDWPGAGRLYASLARSVRRRALRDARAERKLRPRG